ncbi:hypothetical protein [Streptomyces sp. NPDC002692]
MTTPAGDSQPQPTAADGARTAPGVDLRRVLGGPVVTFLAKASEIVIGDVVDSADGVIRVREIVQRPRYVVLAGDPPGQYARMAFHPRGEGPAPRTRVPYKLHQAIRCRRTIAVFGRLTGHSQRVTTHNPVKRGMYTIADGWDAACSCGWEADTPLRSETQAKEEWLDHKAHWLTANALAGHRAFAHLVQVELLAPDLPPVPWRFEGAPSEFRVAVSTAVADLGDLRVEQAREIVAAWRSAPRLSVDDFYSYDEARDEIVHGPRGPRRQVADMRLTLRGEHATSFRLCAQYTADPFDEPAGDAPRSDGT